MNKRSQPQAGRRSATPSSRVHHSRADSVNDNSNGVSRQVHHEAHGDETQLPRQRARLNSSTVVHKPTSRRHMYEHSDTWRRELRTVMRRRHGAETFGSTVAPAVGQSPSRRRGRAMADRASASGSAVSFAARPGTGPGDEPGGDEVDNKGQSEQRQAGTIQGRQTEVRIFVVAQRDPSRQSCCRPRAYGSCSRKRRDDQHHGDRLAERPTEPEHRAADDPAVAERERDRPDHSPPRGTKSERHLHARRRLPRENTSRITTDWIGITIIATTRPAIKLSGADARRRPTGTRLGAGDLEEGDPAEPRADPARDATINDPAKRMRPTARRATLGTAAIRSTSPTSHDRSQIGATLVMNNAVPIGRSAGRSRQR